jgi:hypothetical protein
LKSRYVALAWLCVAAAAQAEPLGFKGVDLGSPLPRVASDPRSECRAVNTSLGDTICSLRAREVETIAGVDIVSLFHFYDAGALTGIQITVAEKGFQRVVDALAGKYGPTKVTVERVQNVKGESFDNRVHRWQQADGVMEAVRYSGRLDRSVIRITDEKAAGRIQQRRAAAKKDPRKDL